MRFVFGLMRRKIMRLAAKREVSYSSLFVRPDGDQLSEIVILLSQERIRPVIDKVSPFGEAKEAIEYLVQGRSKGKIVVKMKNII
ncbi:zinc-binding dehydrogenase [Aeromonas caviae]|nr:zinc-binding dehydrogenase [Aeromonas caviae]